MPRIRLHDKAGGRIVGPAKWVSVRLPNFKDIALKRIDDIRSKIAGQLALEQELKVVIGTCDATCGGQQNQVRGAFA